MGLSSSRYMMKGVGFLDFKLIIKNNPYCVSAPPINGPTANANCAVEIINPKYTGLFSIGTACVKIVIAPFIKPAEPMPATARPTINMSDETAVPHNKEPNSKRKKKERNTYLELKYV
ncbi:hypothetical protein BGAL_0358g00060 [Botrytis galanthina]|uniref:Uncharacterized protein n=1 Tax=Botrytis galanthina TaxID=278940 RepID=A0A4S8QNY3_9HELO|nr:hypothetical protein BGAL_0358g00060 [Botrytis galanthina]